MPERSTPIQHVLPEHVRFVRGIARSLLFDEHEAEDAVQDTLLRALEQPPEPGNIRGWLRVVVRNFALRRRREERRRKRRELTKAPPDHISSPEEAAARIEVQRHVLDAVRDLPEPYRSAIVHRYLDELSREEIAQRLGIPLETVRTRLRRALRLLRERLDSDDREAAPWVAALAPLLGIHRPPTSAVGTAVPAVSLAGKLAAMVAVAASAALFLVARNTAPPPTRVVVAGTPALRASRGGGRESPLATDSGVDAQGPLSIVGVVRDVEGGVIGDARVVAADGSERTSGRDGRFRLFASSADGRARLSVHKDGFLVWDGALDALADSEQQITLVRGAPLTVVVLDQDGVPISGATVRGASREERGVAGMWWSRRSKLLGEGTSDSHGHATLGAAPGGTVEIRVIDPRYAPWRREIDVTGTDSVIVESVLSKGGVVAGKVTDTTGEPVAGARVCSAGWPGQTAVTCADGTYEMRLVAEGENMIFAEAEGFGTGFFGASLGWDGPVPVRVRSGTTLPGVDIVLPLAVEVSGRVVDEAGQPLAGATADCIVGPCPGHPIKATTDIRGRFVVGPFSAGDGRPIRIVLAHEGYAIKPVIRDVPGTPGSLDVGDIEARRCGTIRGIVLDIDGEPIRRGRLELASGDHATLVRPDGTFAMEEVPSGVTRIQALARDPLRRSGLLRVQVEPGASVSGVTVRLLPTRSIRGRVTSPDGKARPGITVGAIAEEDEPVARATTDVTGAFELRDLPEGAYIVGILRVPAEEETAAPDSRVAFTEDALSVRLVVPGVGHVRPSDGGPFLSEPAPEHVVAGRDVTLMLPARGTTVDGRVVDAETGRPIPSFEVSFIEYWHGLIPRASETLEVYDANGRFRYELGEGTWAAEFTAPGYASHRTSVFTSGARETTSLGSIALGLGGRLRGTVQDASGDAVSYARLYLLGSGLQTNRRPVFTNAEGSFDADAIAAGSYTVFILSPRHPFGIVRNVEIGESDTSVLNVRLDRPSPVTIVVTDQEGRPVPGADVSYTCEALMPLTSRLLRSYEPSAWGGCRTDGKGRLVKRFLPAARVLFDVKAEGYERATRAAELKQDCEAVVEIRLERDY